MIEHLRGLARHLWPVMRLRSIFFATLILVAALPGFAALGLRVYENALVRRTEAEVAAQSASIAATAALLWPGASAPRVFPSAEAAPVAPYSQPTSEVDLRYTPILASRPPARSTDTPPDPRALETAQRIAPVVAEIKRTTLASITLLDSHGIVLTGPDAGRSLAQIPEVRDALAGRLRTVLRHNDAYRAGSPLRFLSPGTAIRLHQARPIIVGASPVGVVLVSRSPAALFRGMWEDAGKIAGGTAAILVLLVLLTAVLVRAIVRPIEKLSESARALASGRPSNPQRPTLEVREIRSLYDDFAAMADSIARRSRYLRDFAASVSHEFKTPLAGLKGGIELLQDHGVSMSEADRQRFLANIAGDTERLSRLVGRMMKLAEADMRVGDLADRADLASILARLSDSLRDQPLAIDCYVPNDLPPLAIESDALESVLATLIDNARQAGASHIDVSSRLESDRCVIELFDNGPGVPAADRERIFDPFFTSHRDSGGTGLGLPIARSLVASRGGALTLLQSDSGGRFAISLPNAFSINSGRAV